MNLAALVAALLCLAPHTPEKLATRHARVILQTAADESEAAALLVTGTRESSWHLGCVQGIGGAGTYGLGFPYWRWACAPLKVQAHIALVAYHDKGAPWDWDHAIQGYLGARSRKHPEVQRRIALFEITRERLECACCL